MKIYKQRIIGRFIVDFYCASAKLVIELDGSQHLSEKGIIYDEQRTAFLKQYGLKVIRIPNALVKKDFGNVCAYIDDAVKQSLSRLRDSSLCTREP